MEENIWCYLKFLENRESFYFKSKNKVKRKQKEEDWKPKITTTQKFSQNFVFVCEKNCEKVKLKTNFAQVGTFSLSRNKYTKN